MTRRALIVPIAIVAATVVAAVVVLVAGGEHRGAVAMALLIGVPLLVAMGGGFDEARRATSSTSDTSLGLRLTFFLPGLLGQLAALVVMVWLVITSAADGDVVLAVGVVPFAMFAAWRGWQVSRRIRDSR
ncbi:hypothetical protein ACQPZX_31640 [Actinoplanes sp. CA-142083]|uniref:hypothetical protein n=1 Tax=Actinoplanes sp. CA-142083 TaxID=3239903 RepID=UPI003D925388